jgi:hypothetical protein
MYKFYFLLWLNWAFRLSICSIVLASLFSILITFLIYINQGFITLNSEVNIALWNIFKFWFPITWSFSILLSLFRSLKYIFNKCYKGYKLELFSCDKESIAIIGYGDLIKVWRKWFMLIIWIIVAQMIMAISLTYLKSYNESIFGWFDIYILYIFILIAGYFSFIILSSKCKQIKVLRC